MDQIENQQKGEEILKNAPKVDFPPMLQLKNILFKNISQNDPIKNFILRKMEEKLGKGSGGDGENVGLFLEIR